MARDLSDSTPIGSKTELMSWIAAGEKPPSAFRLGTEHEKFPFYRDDLSPVPYEGRKAAGGRPAAGGIRHLLEGMQGKLGWEPIVDAGHVIGLAGPDGGGAISLEPGGQFELSGAPVETLHQTAAELAGHLDDLKAVAEQHGIGFVSLGHSPLWTRAQTPMMPKSRYRIMADYMPKVGSRGLDMMFRTCTVQVNLDFATEADMVRKLRVALALQPLATALFASSPFSEGQLNGFQSMRSEIWRDTDKARSGMLAFAFDEAMSYEAYVDWALDVPLYFVKRGDTYHDVAGASFRDLMAGRLPQLPGVTATISDWANHLGTLFPEARLKRFLEMRGADAGPPELLNALPAFWVGLLYDQASLDAAWDLVKGWSESDRQGLRDAVPRQGLAATVAGRSLREIARDVLALSRSGLARRGRRDEAGADETGFLDPLDAMVAADRVLAQDLAERFRGRWSGRIEPLFEDFRL
ncbi:MAG TPA: glutamate--cysteine ligase [Bosea sp. (in: a-proteobacteria)]|jgi:glutamate--cysteine ligase|uniref:glutamate--cysteine ligase n=1 Tax=Bosea sp. (in: a-proteobacteria) TaxID=1871050 RepID=UPI002DDDADF0|nr:glutamate--cysteine ligase [Bosea sp. (in: a-proteobacteria)]HEV2553946.1 glutamate--cysteine ligase [Bosea sp. (in: a-proteobacteria)]